MNRWMGARADGLPIERSSSGLDGSSTRWAICCAGVCANVAAAEHSTTITAAEMRLLTITGEPPYGIV